MNKEIHVVGAAIQKEGLTLALQRSESMSLPNLWEFPGGKIEIGESKVEALIREIKEELAVDIRIKEYVNTASYDYDFGRVTLSVYTVEITHGDIFLREHADMKWLKPDELDQVTWAPVDIPAVQILSKQ